MNEGQELIAAPETAIQVFDKFEAEIVEFEEMNSKMEFDLKTEKGITDCTAYLLLLRKVEIRIDKTRKEKGASLRKAVTDLNENAKVWHNRVHTMYEVHDEPLAEIKQAKLDAEIDKYEKEKAELKAIEDARLADLEAREAATSAREFKLKVKEDAINLKANAAQIAKDLEDAKLAAAQEAIEKEKARALAETNRLTEETRKRQANIEHRKDFNNAAALAIENITCDRGISVLVITAIVKGEIPNITMNY